MIYVKLVHLFHMKKTHWKIHFGKKKNKKTKSVFHFLKYKKIKNEIITNKSEPLPSARRATGTRARRPVVVAQSIISIVTLIKHVIYSF